MNNNQNTPPPPDTAPTQTSTPQIQNSPRVANASESQHPTSQGMPTSKNEEIQTNKNFGEALECMTIKGLSQHLQSLPMALQQRIIELTEEFLDKRDLILRKQVTLRNIQTSLNLPRLA